MNMQKKVRSVWFIACCIGVLAAVGRFVWQHHINAELVKAVCNQKPTETVRELIREGADPNTGRDNNTSVVIAASYYGPPSTVQALLDAGATPSQVGPALNGPLEEAAMSWNHNAADMRTILDALHHKGESLEERDVLGYTPLLRALWVGNPVGVRVLLDMGADVHAVTVLKQDVWSFALSNTDPAVNQEIKTLLLEHSKPPSDVGKPSARGNAN